MKKQVLEFVRRGLTACGIGPIVLAVLYLIMHKQGKLDILTVNEVCMAIISLTALAFVAGALNAVYQIERLPLMAAIFIHGSVLYASYLGTYLLNGWLEWGTAPVLVFTGIFVGGYLIIWAVIYFIIKSSTNKVNRALKHKRQTAEEK